MSSPSYTSSAQEIDPADQSPTREQHSRLRAEKPCQDENPLKLLYLSALKKIKECNGS